MPSMSNRAVWNWRRAVSVAGLVTPGSRAVRVELNSGLAADLRGGELPPEARRRRRRTAIDLDLGRHLDAARAARWLGQSWTVEQLTQLGTAPDLDLAKRFGRTEAAVGGRRVKLGIPAYRDRRRKTIPATTDIALVTAHDVESGRCARAGLDPVRVPQTAVLAAQPASVTP
jgi:hypothetical protein